MTSVSDFEKALQIGRPPNVTRLFPNSRALIVSGKFIDRAMTQKGQAIAMAYLKIYSIDPRGCLLSGWCSTSPIHVRRCFRFLEQKQRRIMP